MLTVPGGPSRQIRSYAANVSRCTSDIVNCLQIYSLVQPQSISHITSHLTGRSARTVYDCSQRPTLREKCAEMALQSAWSNADSRNTHIVSGGRTTRQACRSVSLSSFYPSIQKACTKKAKTAARPGFLFIALLWNRTNGGERAFLVVFSLSPSLLPFSVVEQQQFGCL